MTTVERVYKEATTLPLADIQSLIDKLNRLIAEQIKAERRAEHLRAKAEQSAKQYLEAWGSILAGWTEKEKDTFVNDIAKNRFSVDRELSL